MLAGVSAFIVLQGQGRHLGLDDPNDLLDNGQPSLRKVVDAPRSGGYHGYHGAYGVPEPAVLNVQKIDHELVGRRYLRFFGLRSCRHGRNAVGDEEHVAFDELRDEVPPQLRGDLERVHAQRKQDLNDVLRVAVHLLGFQELHPVLIQH